VALVLNDAIRVCSTGLQEATDAMMVALQAIEHEGVSNQAQVLVDMCAYAGTGDVLKVQTLLHLCDEHIVPPKEEKDEKKDGEEVKETPLKDDTFQALAVIGIAVVAMGEDIGSEMSLRQFNHLVCAPVYEHCFTSTEYCGLDAIWRTCHSQSRSPCPWFD
jgi:hypothetical protein